MLGRSHDIDNSFSDEREPTRNEVDELKERIECLQDSLENTNNLSMIVSEYEKDIRTFLNARPTIVGGSATVTLWEDDMMEIRNLLRKLLEPV